MLHMKNLTPYIPDVPWLGNAVYLKDDEGRDWYDYQNEWSPDTVKIFYDPEDGQICAVIRDVTRLSPEALSVVELDPKDVPEGVSHNPEQGWTFWEGVLSRPEAQYAAEARSLRNALLVATDAMMTIDYTINDEMITESQRREAAQVRISLKTWPKSPGWPMIPLPEIPDWMMLEAQKNGFQHKQWP